MTTPTREEIIEKAKELWFQDRMRSGCIEATEINPELEELRESGCLMVAQQMLMTNEYDTYIELERPQPKLKIHNGLLFDWKSEVYKSNILVSGTNSTGKTRLACKLVSTLQNLGWQIIAFDNSSVWKRISDIPTFIKVEQQNYRQQYFYNIPILPNKSVIYDISSLIPENQKAFVDYVLLDLWNNRYYSNIQWCLVVLEEFELYGRSTRGQTAQNLFRIMHAGRNKQIRCLAVSTDLALIDSSFIRLCGLRYHARLNIEVNSKRRFKSYYGKQWLEIANNLEVGQFIYLNKNKLELINVPLFEAKRKPQQYIQPQPVKLGFWEKLAKVILQ